MSGHDHRRLGDVESCAQIFDEEDRNMIRRFVQQEEVVTSAQLGAQAYAIPLAHRKFRERP
ncbi:hypothetical protein [Rhodococcus sp. NPDC058521]|uniref:hypothetical protein n=1 Tax=Rhodococcus sp. NPDC058521 TaxID=3346536 RepID=UPI003656CF8A